MPVGAMCVRIQRMVTAIYVLMGRISTLVTNPVMQYAHQDIMLIKLVDSASVVTPAANNAMAGTHKTVPNAYHHPITNICCYRVCAWLNAR